jgi:hypothetical protein
MFIAPMIAQIFKPIYERQNYFTPAELALFLGMSFYKHYAAPRLLELFDPRRRV